MPEKQPQKKQTSDNGSSDAQVTQFVDKAKEMAGTVAEKAGPAVGKAKDSAGDLVGKVKGAIGNKSDDEK